MAVDEKARVRAALLAARRARPAPAVTAARARIRELVLARCSEQSWRCVAAFEPLPTEPASRQLLAGLHGLGASVLVPVLLPDRDLDWAHWHPDPEWPRPVLGVAAIGRADAVLVPALAVAVDGTRLGRGGGSYDRALVRAAPVPTIAVVYDEEILDALPHRAWDRRVTTAVSPSGWHEFGAPRE